MKILLFLLLGFGYLEAQPLPEKPLSSNDQANVSFFYGAMKEKDNKRAIRLFEFVYKQKFEDPAVEAQIIPQVLDNLIYLNMQENRQEEIKKYKLVRLKQLRIDPAHVEFEHQLEEVINHGDLAKAKEMALEALKKEADFLLPHFYLGYIFIKEKQYQDAYDHLIQWKTVNEREWEWPLLKGICLYRLGKYPEAEREFDRSLCVVGQIQGNSLARIYWSLLSEKVREPVEDTVLTVKWAKVSVERKMFDSPSFDAAADQAMIDDVMTEFEALDTELQAKGFKTVPEPDEKAPWEN